MNRNQRKQHKVVVNTRSIVPRLGTRQRRGIVAKANRIVDGKRKLLGTLTDGDLRASILSGTDLNSSIKKIYNSKPTYLLERNFDDFCPSSQSNEVILLKKFHTC